MTVEVAGIVLGLVLSAVALLVTACAARMDSGGMMAIGILLTAVVCWACAGMGAWWLIPVLLLVGIPLVTIDPRHVREIWQVQVKLRRDARVKRVQELRYPTYIRRWNPERRMAHMEARHAFDVLMKAMEDEARLRSPAWKESLKQLPSCDSSSAAKRRPSSMRPRD